VGVTGLTSGLTAVSEIFSQNLSLGTGGLRKVDALLPRISHNRDAAARLNLKIISEYSVTRFTAVLTPMYCREMTVADGDGNCSQLVGN
jgi:hypothetical protein